MIKRIYTTRIYVRLHYSKAFYLIDLAVALIFLPNIKNLPFPHILNPRPFRCVASMLTIIPTCYRAHMRKGNVFILCVCACLSVFVSIRAITFECLGIGTSFLVWCYILTISKSSLSIKVTGPRSRSLW